MMLSERQKALGSKIGALAILTVMVLTVSRLAVVPVIEPLVWHDIDIALLQERLSAIDAEAARIPMLKQRMEELARDPANQDGLWKGPNDNAVSVAIQSRVRQLLQSAGTNASRLGASTAPDTSGFQRHIVRGAFSGGDKELTDVLVALARQRPHLKIEALTVRGSEVNRTTNPRDPVFATNLNVEFELSALGQSGGGSQ